MLLQLNPTLQTPTKYGHLIILDSLLCPGGKESPSFSPDSMALSLSVLMGFDYIIAE